MDPILTARYGMLAATRRFEESAQRVADLGSGADFAAEAVEQAVSRHQFSASLIAWKTAEELQGELFDALR
jgi:hypothetical protein